MDGLLLDFDIVSLGAIVLVLLSGASFSGIFLAKWHLEHPKRTPIIMGDIVPTFFLGLMSLLLSFTFSMAEHRFESRRELVVEDSNAIGTAFLRTEILPEAEARKSRAILKSYVENRVRFYELERGNPELANLDVEAIRSHQLLWKSAMVGARGERTALMSLYAASINSVIDIYSTRLMAMRCHVPESIFITLVVAGFFGLFTLGYSQKMAQRLSYPSAFLISLFITIALMQIMDIDRQRRGLIRIPQDPMTDLLRQLNHP
jgi:hypothetical protein